jgi:hypothetical protein
MKANECYDPLCEAHNPPQHQKPMSISTTAKEAAERILKNAGDDLCTRQAAEVVQGAIDAETASLKERIQRQVDMILEYHQRIESLEKQWMNSL